MIYVYTHIHTWIYACVFIYTDICICIHIHSCIHACTHTCMYTHKHTHTPLLILSLVFPIKGSHFHWVYRWRFVTSMCFSSGWSVSRLGLPLRVILSTTVHLEVDFIFSSLGNVCIFKFIDQLCAVGWGMGGPHSWPDLQHFLGSCCFFVWSAVVPSVVIPCRHIPPSSSGSVCVPSTTSDSSLTGVKDMEDGNLGERGGNGVLLAQTKVITQLPAASHSPWLCFCRDLHVLPSLSEGSWGSGSRVLSSFTPHGTVSVFIFCVVLYGFDNNATGVLEATSPTVCPVEPAPFCPLLQTVQSSEASMGHI